MLILTKEEINEKIDCFRKLIGIYNTKIEFLQKLLLYYDRNGQTVDCIVLNICVKSVVEDIFSCDEQIQVHPQTINHSEDILHSFSLSAQDKFKQKNESNSTDLPKVVSSQPMNSNEISFNKSHVNVCRDEVLSVKERLKNDNSQMDHSPKSIYSSLYSAISDDTHNCLIKSPKSEPTVINLTNNMHNLDSHHSNLPLKNKIAINSDSKRQSDFKSKKPSVNSEYHDQMNKKNIFLSNSSLDDINQLHLAIKNEELLTSITTNPLAAKLKQFKCEFCSSSFAQKGVLNRHKFLRHSPTIVKPHICPKCQKGFTLKHHLKNHLKCKSGCRFFS